MAITLAVDQVHCSWAERRTFGSRAVVRHPSPYLEPVEVAVATMLAPTGTDPGEARSRIRAQRERLRSSPSPRGRGALASCKADPGVLDDLKSWRSAQARASGVPAYVIFHDATLVALAEALPSNRTELLALPGLGPVKAERYGDTLIALLARSQEHTVGAGRRGT